MGCCVGDSDTGMGAGMGMGVDVGRAGKSSVDVEGAKSRAACEFVFVYMWG